MSEQRFKQALILLGLLALISIGSMFSSVGRTATVPTCRSDWTKCADNSDMVNNYKGMTVAQDDCMFEATKQAMYGTPEWPWGYHFSHFYRGNDFSTGIVTLIEPDAKFQNGFGAMARTRVVCSYDLRNKKTLWVTF
jgi:hypothetical protein